MDASAENQNELLPRRALAHVDSSAIAANVEFLRSRLTGGAGLCAVVKADGYGHGMVESARAAIDGGAERLAVVTAREAELLATAKLGAGLLVLGPLENAELPAAIASGAELTAWNRAQVEAISSAALELGTQVPLHIKLDTGMGRFGAREEGEALDALAAAEAALGTSARAVWTHFATADESGDDYFEQQLSEFAAFAGRAKDQHPGLLVHAANSAATLRSPASHFDFVRTGIAIYGLDPCGGDARATGLVPALSLTSYVASLRDLRAGETVGYGRRFTASGPTRIATIPIGYGDGWRRILSNQSEVLIGGERHSQRGSVSMDSIMVELSAGSSAEVGDLVTLIGCDGEQAISCEDVARQAQTINYEVTCGLTARTTRVHRPGPR
jgi:alanine racemase